MLRNNLKKELDLILITCVQAIILFYEGHYMVRIVVSDLKTPYHPFSRVEQVLLVSIR